MDVGFESYRGINQTLLTLLSLRGDIVAAALRKNTKVTDEQRKCSTHTRTLKSVPTYTD
jgi:hypothetical protein